MLKLPTVILHHQVHTGSHYDWLWLDPVSRDHLTGFRIPCPPNQWAERQSFLAEPLEPHRLAYLTYQGKVSGRRGRVLQVAKGYVSGHAIGDVGWDWQIQVTGMQTDIQVLRVRILPESNVRWRVKFFD